MKLGIQLNNFNQPGGPAKLGAVLRDTARRAEDAGLASLWVMDHFFQIGVVGPAEMDMLEGYTTLAYLAASTEKISLGTMVTGNTYRHPGVLAKTVSTLDVLSGGRAWCGIGAAWFEREHKGLGVAFPPLKERFERLEESIRICLQMWSPDNGPFRGAHYQLAETLCNPQPLSRPHPRLLIGGMGETKTLRLVAQYGQACNLFTHFGLDTVRHKLEVLRGHCERLGTSYDAIEKTVMGRVAFDGCESVGPAGPFDRTWTPATLLAFLEELAQLGIDHFIFASPQAADPRFWDIIRREVAPQAAQLGRKALA